MLNLRRKLLVSVFTLMLAVVAVATTTYAWFTMGVDVEVSGIEMQVQGVDGLFVRVVSVNGTPVDDSKMTKEKYKVTTFKAELDLTEAIQGVKLSPVTYSNGMKALNEITGELADTPVATNSGQYIHIEFEFYSNNDLTVYFSDISTDVKSESYSWTTPVAVDGIKNSDDTFVINPVGVNEPVTAARLANALRVAYKGYTATVDTTNEGVMDKTYADEAIIKTTPSNNVVKPNEYDYSVEEQYGTWCGTSTAYYNAISDADLVDPADENVYYDYAISDTHLDSDEVQDRLMADVALLTLAGDPDNASHGYYGKLTVTIWLEGYDSDCFNAIVNDAAIIKMAFKGVDLTK